MPAYLITTDGVRLCPRDGLKGILDEKSTCPTFAVYWTAREYVSQLLVVGQFPTYEALCHKARWSFVAPALPPHFERFDGVWKLTDEGRWEWVAGMVGVMPDAVADALCLNR